MANDPRNKFSRKPVPEVSSDVKEMSLNDRFKKFYAPNDDKKNRFGDLRVERPEPVPIESPKRALRIGSTILDPETERLRQAAADSRQAVKDNKARTSRDESIAAVISETDFQAILIHFSHTHPQTYWSLFNLTNLTNCLLNVLQHKTAATGVTGLNTRSLETCYQWMLTQTAPPLLEPFPGQRKRGDMAARKVDYTYEKNEEPTAQRVIQRTQISVEENKQLREKPFLELQAEARAGFKLSGRKV